MQYRLTSQSVFPLVEVTLAKGEELQLESGAMVYHNGQISLEGHMNANGKKGIGGALRALGRSVTSSEQWRLNTGAYLAAESSVQYEMVRQSISGALLGGTGGLFVMETKGSGRMLISGYGDIVEVTLDGNQPLVVDNHHVLAWSASLDYQIQVASGRFGQQLFW